MPSSPASDLLRTIEATARAYQDFAFLSTWLVAACAQATLHDTRPGACEMDSHETPRNTETTATEWSIRIGDHVLTMRLSTTSGGSALGLMTTGVTVYVRYLDRGVVRIDHGTPVLVFQRALVTTMPAGYVPADEPWPWHLTIRARPCAAALDPAKLMDFVPTTDEIPLTHMHARRSVMKRLAKHTQPSTVELRDVNEAVICLLAALKAMECQRVRMTL